MSPLLNLLLVPWVRAAKVARRVWRHYRRPPVLLSILPTVRAPAQWHFKRDILDRLDEYFLCFGRLRVHDPHSYALFRRVGLVVATAFVNPTHKHWKHFRTVAFGGILIPSGDGPKIGASAMFFEKIKHPIGVRRMPGMMVYRLSSIWDQRARRIKGLPRSLMGVCHVAVDPEGEILLLPEVGIVKSTFGVRRGRQKQQVSLHQRQWQYPQWICSVGEEHDKTPEQWAADMLRMAAGTYGQATSRLVIRVKRGGEVAMFGIALDRCKYFFADREKFSAVATDGKRKRIFHYVVEHPRRVRGQTVMVKAHYRGMRTFIWGRSEIHIVFPDNTDVLYFDKPGKEFLKSDPRARDSKTIGRKRVGRMFAKVLER